MADRIEKTNNAWIDAVKLLADPYEELKVRRANHEASLHRKVKKGFFTSLFSESDDAALERSRLDRKFNDDLIIDDTPLKQVEDLKGVYLHGSPGCGKTFLMDLFYSQVEISNKRRASYTSFVLQIHKMNHENQKKKIEDGLFRTSLDVAKQYRLFCFDEVQVTEPGDAILMKRFFDIMWQLRVVLVVSMVYQATSNRRPEDLYKGGIQKEYFLPFIDMLKENCEVIKYSSSDQVSTLT